jgi:hypothetical protein
MPRTIAVRFWEKCILAASKAQVRFDSTNSSLGCPIWGIVIRGSASVAMNASAKHDRDDMAARGLSANGERVKE